MKPDDLAAEQFAQQLGVSTRYAKNLVRRMGTPVAFSVNRAALAAAGEAVLAEEVASVQPEDLEFVAGEADPALALGELIHERAERSMRAQIAAHASWAQTDDRAARTQRAREAAEARFERQVDPEGKLSPAERSRRAQHAKKAYFLGLALKSAKVRRAKARSSSGE